MYIRLECEKMCQWNRSALCGNRWCCGWCSVIDDWWLRVIVGIGLKVRWLIEEAPCAWVRACNWFSFWFLGFLFYFCSYILHNFRFQIALCSMVLALVVASWCGSSCCSSCCCCCLYVRPSKGTCSSKIRVFFFVFFFLRLKKVSRTEKNKRKNHKMHIT